MRFNVSGIGHVVLHVGGMIGLTVLMDAFWYTMMFFTVWAKSMFPFWTPATRTPVFVVHCKTLWFLKYDGSFWYSDVGVVIWFWVPFNVLRCSLQSEQSPSSHSEHLQHRHPWLLQNHPNLYIKYDGNFPYSDVGIVIWCWYLSIHCGVLGSLCIVLHILNTCNTDTRAPYRII